MSKVSHNIGQYTLLSLGGIREGIFEILASLPLFICLPLFVLIEEILFLLN